ncbi:MAG: LPS export ABC transporter periplasmic protein LptC [Paludibacteraceae bacterium]|nr:LPS export ABC transporter periplasmic protein LptC [Paludibacteraceae bacterium]
MIHKQLYRVNHYSITTVLCSVVMLFLVVACADDKLEITQTQNARENLPSLTASNITTIISDSGITRYRISTSEWKIFDKAAEPYWLFPKGITMERFNQTYKVDAQMKSDKAVFYSEKSLWEFTGNVKAKNLNGEQFETDQLFWDENNQRIYSDKKIKITQQFKVISGVGFESNSELTRYTIKNPQGIIPVDEAP